MTCFCRTIPASVTLQWAQVVVQPINSKRTKVDKAKCVDKGELSLLGLLAKIKCSNCSYQFDRWYAAQRAALRSNEFLSFGERIEACFALSTDCPGLALLPGAVHIPFGEIK